MMTRITTLFRRPPRPPDDSAYQSQLLDIQRQISQLKSLFQRFGVQLTDIDNRIMTAVMEGRHAMVDKFQQLEDQMDASNTKLADAIAEVASDVQSLLDQLTGGISASEAADIQKRFQAKVDRYAELADNLKALGDSTITQADLNATVPDPVEEPGSSSNSGSSPSNSGNGQVGNPPSNPSDPGIPGNEPIVSVNDPDEGEMPGVDVVGEPSPVTKDPVTGAPIPSIPSDENSDGSEPATDVDEGDLEEPEAPPAVPGEKNP